MAERTSVVRLMANVTDFKRGLQDAERSLKGVGDEAEKAGRRSSTTLGRLTESAQKNRAAWNDAGTAMSAFGAVTVLALGATVKAAVDWESAWTGVLKTVDGTDRELAAVEQGLRGLARTLPATHGEIAAVAEAAGQLGIKTGDIVSFTRTMVDLGETTNLSADEAATSIAQMMNVMQTAPDDVGRLGATLVALGNAGASTERDIIQMSQRISGAAAVVGMSEADVLAFANAVASMGIEVESGGTSVSRVLTDMSKAAQTGGAELQVFAETAGVSAQEFARAFSEDPAEAFALFIEGLGGIQEAGGNVFEVLDELGFSDVRVSQALLGMASSGDLLRESLDLGADAWRDNTALAEEAGKRYDTTAAKLAIARNGITDAAIEIGETFLPALASMAEGLADVAGWFADMPDPIKSTIGGLAGVAGAGTLAAGAFLLLFPRAIDTYKAFQTLRDVSPGTATALGKVGKAAGIAGVLIAAASAMNALNNSMSEAPPTMEQTTDALLKLGTSTEALDALFQVKPKNLAQGGWSDQVVSEINGIEDAARRLTSPSNYDRVDDFFGMLAGWAGSDANKNGSETRTKLISQFNQVGESLAFLVQSGNAELASKQFEMLAAEWERGGGSIEELRDLLPAYEEALAGVQNEQTIAAESAGAQALTTADLSKNLSMAYGSLTGYAAALGLSEEATEKLIEDSNALGESLAGFVDPLGVYTGLLEEKRLAEEESAREAAESAGAGADSWRDFVGDVRVSFADYMQQLRDQVTAQENWQLNMLTLAGRVSEGTLAELARMGPEGAPLVADLVNQSDAILDEFDDITARRSREATDAWGAQLTMAAPVLAEIGRTAGAGVVAELAAKLQAGTTTVAAIAAQYGIELAGGINPILVSLGKRPIAGRGGRLGGLVEADGGVVDFYADGGMRENHVAQIAPAGAYRLWAEDETGGEAYIPLHPGKRTRSVDIWRQVGDRLGVQFEEFANGGFSSVDQVPGPPSTAPYRAPLSTAGDAAMDATYRAAMDFVRENGPPGRALAWAKSQVGKPYIWGGVGPAGYDCSGFMSAITNVILGRSPHSRVGATANFPWPGFAPGNGQFTIGSTPNAGGGIGHMAGTLLGTNVESRGGQGVVVGPSARGASSPLFTQRAHLAMVKGGILNPHVRDAGGPLLPGYTFNGTGGQETVIPGNARLIDAAALRPFLANQGSAAPARFEGDLYLDSGEFLGKVRGVAAAVMDQRDAQTARDVRSARS